MPNLKGDNLLRFPVIWVVLPWLWKNENKSTGMGFTNLNSTVKPILNTKNNGGMLVGSRPQTSRREQVKKYQIFIQKWERNGTTPFWLPFEKYGELWRDEIHCLLYRIQYACSLSKSIKEVFNVQAAWHSPNMLPIMIYSQVSRIITWQPTFGRNPLSAQRRAICRCVRWVR